MAPNVINIPDAYSFSSNSPKIGVEVERVAREIQATEDHKVVLLKPIIDKLCLTISGKGVIQHVKELNAAVYWDELEKAAFAIGKEGWHPDITECRVEGYRTGLRVALNGDTAAFIGFKPRKKSNAAVRLELNPYQMSEEGLLKLLGAWKAFEGDNIPLAAHLTSARVTRCDVAFDILNLKLADLMIYCPEVWKVWTCGSMETGIQTVQLYKAKKKQSPFLDPKRRSNVLVYDKRAERVAFGLEPEFGPLAHTRIEFNLNKNGLLTSLIGTAYPGKDWRFCRMISKSPPLPSNRWKQFLDSARLRGFANAEALLDEDDRAALEKANNIPEQRFRDLLDESVWKHWPAALEAPGIKSLVDLAAMDPKALIEVGIFEL